MQLTNTSKENKLLKFDKKRYNDKETASAPKRILKKIQLLKRNILNLEKDLHQMSNGISQIRHKVNSRWS